MKIKPTLFAVDEYVYLMFKSFELVEGNIHNIFEYSKPAFLKLWSADHKWSSGSALVVLLD